ncbi:MAG TPA: hypothetical protein VNN22_11745 [Verrucomicrobiae bacterium]|nr:hypothetical protein [Verrucomicrobiae bacterium]
MNLYEVIYSGSQGKCDDDSSTVFLVRATDFLSAVEEVALNGMRPSGNKKPLALVVYEIGADLSSTPAEDSPRILRGPYFARAYNYGWKSWERKIEGSDYTNQWEEKPYAMA